MLRLIDRTNPASRNARKISKHLMLRLISALLRYFSCLSFISKHLMLRLIKGGSIPTNYRFSISKHLMLRLIGKENIKRRVMADFKTSYVTVNLVDLTACISIATNFKTSYVTVNLTQQQMETRELNISKHLMLRLITVYSFKVFPLCLSM